jgi:HSP20 family molecular chaperone IbpA
VKYQEDTTMKTRSDVSNTPAPEPRAAEAAIRPRVDVHEDAEGITLLADLPGVSSDRLQVQVDRDTLTIEGDAELSLPESIQALHAEVRSRNYRRSFALSNELDTGAIRASLRDGVLELRIPKRAELKPRRIDIKVA